jgi:TRAP-type C4-dicarboxylate transport system permease small subunit
MCDRLIAACCRAINYLIAAMLAVMVVLVFGNVFMRYAFNSGFTVSEELSRWLFVWLTFLGAVVALREHAHLGTDMLMGRLGPRGRKVCMAVSLLLMLYCLWLVFKGSYDQTLVNLDSTSAVMEVSMGWFYASGMAFSLLSAPILVLELWRLVSSQTDDEHLMMIQESEETPHGETASSSPR